MENALVKPETLAEMIAGYEQALQNLAELEPIYEKTKHLLKSHCRSYTCADLKISREALKFAAWNEVFHKTNLYQLMSIKDSESIKAKLWGRNDEKVDVPDFTMENVLAFIEAKTQDMPNMLAKKIVEVYNILRPNNRWQKLKTNDKSLFEGIGKKVILSWFFEPNFSGGMRIRYQREQETNAIQEVFWLLDGKGIPHDADKLYHKLYKSECGDAYEDEYFRIKGYGNGNMHLEFKRIDLVAKIVATVKEKLFGHAA